MLCKKCKIELVENTDQFNETEMHLLGPNWTHYKCNKCGEGTHISSPPSADGGLEIGGEINVEQIETIAINDNDLIADGEATAIDDMIEQAKELVKNINLLKEYADAAMDIPESQKLNEAIEARNEAQKMFDEAIAKINVPTIEINDQEEKLQNLLKKIGERIDDKDWKKDPIQKTKKRVERNGAIIVRSMRTDRKIIPELFVKNHPLITNELVNEGKITIPLKYAEEKLSKTDVNAVCSIKETKTYEMRVNHRA